MNSIYKHVKHSSMAAIALTMLAVSFFAVAAVIAAPAQNLTTLLSFDGSNGADPVATLVQGFDGNYYGTTWAGGASNNGTVFKIRPQGTLTTLYNFCSQPNCTDGANPPAGLALATNGNFYGTTTDGGAYGFGTVFKITPKGS